MKILIIEDELLTAEDLTTTLKQVNPQIEIIAILSSVYQATEYLKSQPEVDLIFSDIQLGDGLSFEIFNIVKINVPVIFCTAYDEYALSAFKTNGIDYILKPFDNEGIKIALLKFESLQNTLSSKIALQYESVLKALEDYEKNASTTLMVSYREKILPIDSEGVAFFYVENQLTYLYTFNKQKYTLSETLEIVEKKVGENFFRVNRQILINKKSIISATNFFPRKLVLTISMDFEKEIIVGKEKKTKFIAWLSS